MTWLKKSFWLALLFVLACSNGDSPGLSVDGRFLDGDLVEGEEPNKKPPIKVPLVTTTEEFIPGDSGQLFSRAYIPIKCNKGCPALVLVPDDLGGVEQFDCCAADLAEALTTVVITYNPPGRGDYNERSEGEEDYGGKKGQDALKDVANHWEKKTIVDGNRFGILSMGYGVGAASGALARHHASFLDFVSYFIDVEGPPNRCFASQSPYYVDLEGWYVNEDGPGVSTTRCDFDLNLRKVKFPAGTSSNGKGFDGTPNSYICNANGPIIRQSGKSCEDDKWWQEREARTYLPNVPVHYLRLQFAHDHTQPSRYNAREAMYHISQGAPASYQLNGLNKNNSTKGFTEDKLYELGAYNISSSGNGFGDDTYDTLGDFKKIPQSKLFATVLPKYVAMMQERASQ
jgi:hypothetical protein